MSQLELLTEGVDAEQASWAGISKVAVDIQKREIRPYVLLALKELSGDKDERLHSVASERFACVRAVVRHLARLCSARTTQVYQLDDVRTFLDGLRFNAECSEELAALLCSEQAYSRVPTHRPSGRRLDAAYFRVDISLCQVNIDTTSDEESQRVVMGRDIRVILILRRVDGTSHAYRMSVARLHELRYAVATLLKQMLMLERRNCMRRK